MVKPIISVIIPVFNEENIIQNTIQQFAGNEKIELIVVDGKSQDRTIAIVTQLSQKINHLKLVTTNELGRANQMNYGAKLATGDILLFLHADTLLPINYQQIIQNILQNTDVILGAFSLKINDSQKSLRLIEKMVDWRSRFLSLPYGDQGFFLTKNNFQRLGGFANLPIMEDFNFVKQARKYGKIKIANQAVITSARRWQKLGVIKTTIINQLIILGYYCKISPAKLRNFYRGSGNS